MNIGLGWMLEDEMIWHNSVTQGFSSFDAKQPIDVVIYQIVYHHYLKTTLTKLEQIFLNFYEQLNFKSTKGRYTRC